MRISGNKLNPQFNVQEAEDYEQGDTDFNDFDRSPVNTSRSNRKHIVIDMPAIVFNAATPDMSEKDPENNVTSLSKAYKQNELRENYNLFIIVLSMISEFISRTL